MQRRIKLSHNFLWMLLTTKADERIATYKICWLSNKKVSPAHSPPKERANVINFLIKHPWRDSVSVELHSLEPAALLKMNSAWEVLRIVQHHPPSHPVTVPPLKMVQVWLSWTNILFVFMVFLSIISTCLPVYPLL